MRIISAQTKWDMNAFLLKSYLNINLDISSILNAFLNVQFSIKKWETRLRF
jgi:hypothetical protein